MNAARALRVARLKAGLSQSELARRAGVSPSMVNRVERGKVIPQVNTLARMLAAAGAKLTIERVTGGEIDPEPIRALLRLEPSQRLAANHQELLDELCRRGLRFVIVGAAAARLHGAPLDVPALEIVAPQDSVNLRKLERLLRSFAIPDLIVLTPEEAPGDPWNDAEELPWIPAPRVRVLNNWVDFPDRYIASIEYLLSTASPEREELLHAVQDETDLINPGFRIYRDPARRELRLPPTPTKYRPKSRSRKDQAHGGPRSTVTN